MDLEPHVFACRPEALLLWGLQLSPRPVAPQDGPSVLLVGGWTPPSAWWHQLVLPLCLPWLQNLTYSSPVLMPWNELKHSLREAKGKQPCHSIENALANPCPPPPHQLITKIHLSMCERGLRPHTDMERQNLSLSNQTLSSSNPYPKKNPFPILLCGKWAGQWEKEREVHFSSVVLFLAGFCCWSSHKKGINW